MAAACNLVACADVLSDPFPANWTGPVIVASGSRTSVYSNTNQAANTLFDGRELSVSAPPQDGYCVNVQSAKEGIFWFGGYLHLDISPTMPYQEFYHPAGKEGYVFEGILVGDGDRTTVEAVRSDNCWDNIKVWKTENFTVKGCLATNCHDDFIENDNMCAGVVEDCLIDGGYVFYSARSGGFEGNPPDKVVTIRNNVVRLKPFAIDLGAESPQGTGKTFKVHAGYDGVKDGSNRYTKLRVLDNIFLVEARSYAEFLGSSVPQEHLGFPMAYITEMSGNVVIWTGPGDYPGELPSPYDSTKVKLYTGEQYRGIWETARDKWLEAHPWVDRRGYETRARWSALPNNRNQSSRFRRVFGEPARPAMACDCRGRLLGTTGAAHPSTLPDGVSILFYDDGHAGRACRVRSAVSR
jgi:hypothetical protein